MSRVATSEDEQLFLNCAGIAASTSENAHSHGNRKIFFMLFL